jgi:hypothetical protein
MAPGRRVIAKATGVNSTYRSRAEAGRLEVAGCPVESAEKLRPRLVLVLTTAQQGVGAS